MRSACCVICLEDDAEPAVGCSRGHKVCASCFSSYVDGICKDAKEVEIPALKADERKVFGKVFCPCTGAAGGCDSAAFSDATVSAALVSSVGTLSVHATYLKTQTLLPISDAAMAAYEEANSVLQAELTKMRASADVTESTDVGSALLAKQLRRAIPNARQCRQCGWGPMAFRACSDLAAHHGQVVASLAGMEDEDGRELDRRVVKIDNSCPKCGCASRPPSRSKYSSRSTRCSPCLPGHSTNLRGFIASHYCRVCQGAQAVAQVGRRHPQRGAAQSVGGVERSGT